MMGIIDTFELPCIDMMVITTIWVIPYAIMMGKVEKYKFRCNAMLDYNENQVFFALIWCE